MSEDQDRIPVATNGHRHPLRGEDRAEGIVAAEPAPASAAPEPAPEGSRTPQVNPVMGPPAFTPTQIAVGFGLVASLIVLLLGRRRRRG
jgi:hypothetical protein